MKFVWFILIILMLSSVGYGVETKVQGELVSTPTPKESGASSGGTIVAAPTPGQKASSTAIPIEGAMYDIYEGRVYKQVGANNFVYNTGKNPKSGALQFYKLPGSSSSPEYEFRGSELALKENGEVKFYASDGKSFNLATSTIYVDTGNKILRSKEGFSSGNLVFDKSMLPDGSNIEISEDGQSLFTTRPDGVTQTVYLANGRDAFYAKDGAVYTIELTADGSIIYVGGSSDSNPKIIGATIDGNSFKVNPATTDVKETLTINGRNTYEINTFDVTEDNLQQLSSKIASFDAALAEVTAGGRIDSSNLPQINTDGISYLQKISKGGYVIKTAFDPDDPFSAKQTLSTIQYTSSDGKTQTVKETYIEDGITKRSYKTGDVGLLGDIRPTISYTNKEGGRVEEIPSADDGTSFLKTINGNPVGIIDSEGATSYSSQVITKSGFFGTNVQAVNPTPLLNIEGKNYYVTSSGDIVGDADPVTGIREEITLNKEQRDSLGTQKDWLQKEAKELLEDKQLNLKEQAKEGLNKKQKEFLQARAEKFNIDNPTGRTADVVFGFMKTVQGSYGVSALFMGQEELDRRFAEAQESLSSLYLGEVIESAMCDDIRESPLVQDGGIGFIETLGGQAKVAVSIQGRAQEVMTFTNGSEYLYKITYIIKNDFLEDEPFSEDWIYNVKLSGDKTVNLWTADKIVPPESSQTYTKTNTIVFYSENIYTQLCVMFNPEPAAMETNRICNTFVMEESEPSAFDLPQQSGGSSSGSSSGSSTPELNTGEL